MAPLGITLILALSTGISALAARVMLEMAISLMMRSAVRRTANATVRLKDATFALQAPAA
jgi:hypothetical protein